MNVGDNMNKSYHLPTSGQIIGTLFEVLQVTRPDHLQKEMQRYFRGEKIDVRVVYRMEAGKEWTQAEAEIVSQTDLNVRFAFGLPYHSFCSYHHEYAAGIRLTIS